MADIELTTQTQDTSFDLDAVVIGADSQAASAPSVYLFSTIWTYLKTLANTWSGVQTFTAGAVVENGLTVNGGITSDVGVYYLAGGTDVAVLDGGTGASTAADARTNLGLAIGSNVQAHSAVLDGTTASFTTADESKLDAIEAAADVTDTANVTAAGALMDSEVTNLSGIKTLTVPDTTTITAFGASLVDDVDAAAARATIGVDAAGTDNSTDVTLVGTPDYITLAGQVLTRNPVDLAADVTGNLPVTNLASGTGANSSTFWRGDGSWVTPAGAGDMVAATYDPAGIVQQLVGLSAPQTLTNKTLTSPTINGGAIGSPVTGIREQLTADRTYYVRTDGNDANTGLVDAAGGAFLTIQKAINSAAAIDLSVYDVTIQLADGTYTLTSSNLVTGPWVGAGNVEIVGNVATPANVLVTSATVVLLSAVSGARIKISAMELRTTGTGAASLSSGSNSVVTIGAGVIFGACAGTQMMSQGGGAFIVEGNYSITGNAQVHMGAYDNGRFICGSRTVTITGTPAFAGAFLALDRASIGLLAFNTYSGSATGPRFSIIANSVATTVGATLPGDVAGSTSTGGLYS